MEDGVGRPLNNAGAIYPTPRQLHIRMKCMKRAYLVIKVIQRPEISTTDIVDLAVEIRSKADLSINDSGVASKILDVEKCVGGGLGGHKHSRDPERPVNYSGGSRLRLQMKVDDNTERICCSTKSLQRVSRVTGNDREH